jgi:ribosomal protein L17
MINVTDIKFKEQEDWIESLYNNAKNKIIEVNTKAARELNASYFEEGKSCIESIINDIEKKYNDLQKEYPNSNFCNIIKILEDMNKYIRIYNDKYNNFIKNN